jgi:hypothetical protein
MSVAFIVIAETVVVQFCETHIDAPHPGPVVLQGNPSVELIVIITAATEQSLHVLLVPA